MRSVGPAERSTPICSGEKAKRSKSGDARGVLVREHLAVGMQAIGSDASYSCSGVDPGAASR